MLFSFTTETDLIGNVGRTLLGLSQTQVGYYIVVSVVLVSTSALAAGLTLGIFSLDLMELEVLKRSGSPKEKAAAMKILPLLENPNQLLVTLLLINSGSNTALPIFVDQLLNPWASILISVTAIFIFAEVLPQALFSRHGLILGAGMVPIVKAARFVCWPIAYPGGKLLDWTLGSNQVNTFKRKQLKTLVDLHGTENGLGGALTSEEINVITGALDLTHKIAYKSMTTLDKVVMLSTEDPLVGPAVDAAFASGHSRIPIYRGNDRTDVVGLVLAKDLLLEFKDGRPPPDSLVGGLSLRQLPRLMATTPMYDMLRLFQTGRCHMALLMQPDEVEIAEMMEVAGDSSSSSSSGSFSRAHSQRTLSNGTRSFRRNSRRHARGSSPTPTMDTYATAHSANLNETEMSRQNTGRPGAAHVVDVPATELGAASSHQLGLMPSLRAGLASLRRPSHPLDADASHRSGSSSSSSSSSSSGRTRHTELIEALEDLEDALEENRTIPGQPLGIITIEDVIEELLRHEILDETDQFLDNERMVLASAAGADMTLKLPERLQTALGLLARDPNNKARISRGLVAAQVLRRQVGAPETALVPTAAAAAAWAAAAAEAEAAAGTSALGDVTSAGGAPIKGVHIAEPVKGAQAASAAKGAQTTKQAQQAPTAALGATGPSPAHTTATAAMPISPFAAANTPAAAEGGDTGPMPEMISTTVPTMPGLRTMLLAALPISAANNNALQLQLQQQQQQQPATTPATRSVASAIHAGLVALESARPPRGSSPAAVHDVELNTQHRPATHSSPGHDLVVDPDMDRAHGRGRHRHSSDLHLHRQHGDYGERHGASTGQSQDNKPEAKDSEPSVVIEMK